MEITLNQAKDIVVIKQQTVNSNKVTRGAVVDDEQQKIVFVFYSVNKSPLVKLILWQGDEYDEIGNWTYEQVDERIKQLL